MQRASALTRNRAGGSTWTANLTPSEAREVHAYDSAADVVYMALLKLDAEVVEYDRALRHMFKGGEWRITRKL